MNKKLTGIFAMCALLLTGCQGAKESSKEITPPDTGWGKTVDEVLADWNLDRDQVEIFSETNSAAAIQKPLFSASKLPESCFSLSTSIRPERRENQYCAK